MDDAIAALAQLEGWRAEGAAARVHYNGGDDDAQFAIEYYATHGGEGHGDRRDPDKDGGGVGDGDEDGDPGDGNSGGAVLYWQVPPDGTTAAPVPRASVPTPLRKRIRRDLAAADVDPSVERREL